MAEPDDTWEASIKTALDKNKTAGVRPWSWRQLHRAVALNTGTKEESAKRTVNRARAGNPTETVAQQIADALGVDRGSLPGSRPRPSTNELLDRLDAQDERLSAQEQHLERIGEQLAELIQLLGGAPSPGGESRARVVFQPEQRERRTEPQSSYPVRQ